MFNNYRNAVNYFYEVKLLDFFMVVADNLRVAAENLRVVLRIYGWQQRI